MKNLLSSVRLILTLKCERSTQLVSEGLDRDLSLSERCAIRLHYVACWSCRRFAKQMDQVRAAFRQHPDLQPSDKARLSPEAMRRIQDAVQRASEP